MEKKSKNLLSGDKVIGNDADIESTSTCHLQDLATEKSLCDGNLECLERTNIVQTSGNPPTNNSEVYKKVGVSQAIHGVFYQVKLLMYFLNRHAKQYANFGLGTEMKKAYKYDDIVITYQDIQENSTKQIFKFVQVKHSQDLNRKIKLEDLLMNNKEAGKKICEDYSLAKYFMSFFHIKREFNAPENDLREFIIITNVNFDESVINCSDIVLDRLEPDKEDFFYLDRQGERYKLSIKKESDIFKKLEESLKTMLKHADKTFDDDINEFFDKSVWYVHQPNEKDLEGIIKRELKKDLNLEQVDLLCDTFLSKMMEWFKEKEGRYLKAEDLNSIYQESFTKKDIISTLALSAEYLQDIENLNIDFQNVPEKLETFVQNETSTQIFNLVTPVVKLGSQLVYQALKSAKQYYERKDSYIFIDVRKFSKFSQTIINTYRSENVNLFVIACNEDSTIFYEQIQNLLPEIQKNRKKKFLLISQMEVLSRLKVDKILMKTETLNKECYFRELSAETQKNILEKDIFLQKKKTNIKKLVCPFEGVRGQDMIKLDMVLKDERLMKLILDEPIYFGREIRQLDDENDYIKRRFRSREISQYQLSTFHDSVLVFSGPPGTVRALVSNIIPFEKFRETLSLPKHHISILLPSESEEWFSMLKIDHPDHKIHWFRVERYETTNKIFWHNSHNCDLHDLTKIYTEKELLEESCENVLIISDFAGMGKSTVLNIICNTFKENESKWNCWVFRINLNDFSTLFLKNNEQCLTNEELAITFFINEMLEPEKLTDFEKILIKMAFNEKHKLLLAFDGFDEICPVYMNFVMSLLKVFCQKNTVRLLITTRPHMLGHLRAKLGGAIFSLSPLERNDQITFLTRYWLKSSNEKDEDHLRSFSEKVIGTLEKSIKDKERMFTGVPLQIKMTAEILKDTLRKSLPDNINLDELYKRYITKKMDLHIQEKFHCVTSSSLNIGKLFKKNFYNTHIKLSLYNMFSKEETAYLLPDDDDCDDDDENNISILFENIKSGQKNEGIIIDIIQESPVFIHRTFSEYFIACYLKGIMLKGHLNERVRDLILKKILFKSQFQVIRIFLNGMLTDTINNKPTNMVPTESDYSLVTVVVEENFYIANTLWNNVEAGRVFSILQTVKDLDIKVCTEIAKDFLKNLGILRKYSKMNFDEYMILAKFIWLEQLPILRWLLTPREKNGAGVNINDLCDKDQEKYAIESETREYALRIMYQQIGETGVDTCMSMDKGPRALHHAAKTGALELVEWMVLPRHKGGGGIDINCQDHDGLSALHHAAKSANLKLVSWMATPMKEYGGGADINCKDHNGQTALHHAITNGSLELVQWIGTSVERGGGGADINSQDCIGQTPLHCAVRHAKSKIVRWMAIPPRSGGGGADMECKDYKGESVVHHAVQSGNLELIQLIASIRERHWRPDINYQDYKGQNTMHHAARSGNLELVRWIVTLYEKNGGGSITDCLDHEGQLVLHHASKSGALNLVQWLTQPHSAGGKGSDLDYRDHEGRSALHFAAKSGAFELVKWMVLPKEMNGGAADKNCQDHNGQSVLHYAAQSGNLDLVKWMVSSRESGGLEADLNHQDHFGQTALHHATNSGYLEIVKWMIDPYDNFDCVVADINCLDNRGQSALHRAAKNGHFKLVKWMATPTEINLAKNNQKVLRKNYNIIRINDNGSNVNFQDYKGRSALHFAASSANLELVKWMMTPRQQGGGGANVTCRDYKKQSALHYAATSGNPKLVKCISFLEDQYNI